MLDPLLALAKATKGEGWWEDYNDVLLDGFGLYLELEASASAIRTYDAELIHGLLQTPEYHRVIAASDGADGEAGLVKSEALRQERRQHTLYRDSPCRITAIIGEAALHWVLGSPEVMDGQLRDLRALTRENDVSIRILTWAAGAHAGLRGGAFTIMDFEDDADPDIVYLESHTAARYLEHETQLRKYREAWTILTEQSVPLEEYGR